MNFYEFDQNNSGGVFITNDQICRRLYIEAETPKQANIIAESLGCYFDGANDCPCCGNRWYPVTDFNAISPKSIEEHVQDVVNHYSWGLKPEARVYYADGTVKEFSSQPKEKTAK